MATSTTRARYDDPACDEAYILRTGIHNQSGLRAAMARTNKSSMLLGAIIGYAIDGRFHNLAAGRLATIHDILTPLLTEPNLRAWDLLCMTRAMRGFGPLAGTALRVAICTHPRTEPDSALGTSTLLGALWGVTPTVAAHVAVASGTLRVAVIAWVQRIGPTGFGLSVGVTPEQRQLITDTSVRWATWAKDNPARAAFLLTASFGFTCEDDMFAAGAALTSPAAATA